LLYRLLKLPARIAIHFYCRYLRINYKEFLKAEGPLLIAANHPNSFLDAVILATLFNKPIYSLARGDAFVNGFYKKLLASLNMLPVYRISEGAENLEHNYTTFDSCIEIFKKGGIVLMFSEGRCINEWHLRPLKKGTARLAMSAWQQNIPLKVLPLGINYSSFRIFGKDIILNFGEVIGAEEGIEQGGKGITGFNERLWQQLKKLVIEIDEPTKEKVKKTFAFSESVIKKIILFFPALAGYIIHAPLYYSAVLSVRNRANDHYDSVIVGLLFISYPVYIIALTLACRFITGSIYAWLLILIIPFTAWCTLQVKRIY
jgi:1-acyl-sn-glycerol-3-phosphate acyltransferase